MISPVISSVISSVIGTLRQLWREHRLLLLAFLLALAVTVFFAIRMAVFWIYWADPAHRNQAIEAWMTPRYIAHSWDVPPPVVGAALGLEPDAGRMTVGDVAARDGTNVEDLSRRIVAAILIHRAERSSGGPDAHP